MENINCILCNNNKNDDRIVIEENGFTGRKCPHCGLIYISPRPTLSEVGRLYENNCISAKSHIGRSFSKSLHSRYNLSILRHYAKQGSLLEIGAGAGYFLCEAKKMGFDVYGIELNEIKADFINNKLNIPCETKTLHESFNKKRFDVIYHCNVISHFYDPVSEFYEMNNRLNTNGIIIFETGNLGDVKEKYFYLFKGEGNNFGYPGHLFFFSEQSIKNLLALAGFEIIGIRRYSILFQLRIIRLLGRIKTIIKSSLQNNHKSVNILTTQAISDFSKISETKNTALKEIFKNARSTIFYFMRYKIGQMLPKKGKPQTILVIAKKAKTCPNEDLEGI